MRYAQLRTIGIVEMNQLSLRHMNRHARSRFETEKLAADQPDDGRPAYWRARSGEIPLLTASGSQADLSR
jgi:hypothetical protein